MNPRFWLAVHNQTPWEAAPKKDTPVEVLRWLAESTDNDVLAKLASNPSIPLDVARFLAAQPVTYTPIAQNLITNTRVPISVVRKIYKSFPWPSDIRASIGRRLRWLDFMSLWRGFAAAIIEVIANEPHQCVDSPDPFKYRSWDQDALNEAQGQFERGLAEAGNRLGELDPRDPEQYPEAESLIREVGNLIQGLNDIGCELNLSEREMESRLKLWKRHSAIIFTHDNPEAALPPPEALRSMIEALKITHRDYHLTLGKEIEVRSVTRGSEDLAVSGDEPPLKVEVLPTTPDWLKGIYSGPTSEDYFAPWWNVKTLEPRTLTTSRGEQRTLSSGTLATTLRPMIYYLTFGLDNLYLETAWIDSMLADAERFEANDES